MAVDLGVESSGARRPRRDGGLVGGRSIDTGGWWTHGLPPQLVNRGRRHAAHRGGFRRPSHVRATASTATCSSDCPDWAVMCKHAAAVLYGVGSRLDDRPELLFRLRDVDAEDLVVGDMALPDASAGDDVLAGDLADIFGIDLDPADSGAAAARQRTTGRRRPRRGRPSGFQPTARRVAELRHQGGFSVPEFAGLLRVSASTVYRWEAARGPLALRAGQEDALQVLYRAIEKRQT